MENTEKLSIASRIHLIRQIQHKLEKTWFCHEFSSSRRPKQTETDGNNLNLVVVQVRIGRFVSAYPWWDVNLKTPETPRGKNTSWLSVCPKICMMNSQNGIGPKMWMGH